MAVEKYIEYRGCEGLVYAEILNDNNIEGEGYVTGEVKALAGMADISKSVDVKKASKYYDNQARIVLTSEGEDVVTLTTSVPEDAVLADVNGRVWDETLKMYIECPIVSKYYAIGYQIKDSDGVDRYVWRHKGYFLPPNEESATIDDGTDGKNMSIEFHGVYTNHIFANGSGAGKASTIKSYAMRTDAGKDLSDFFATVTSPDTVFSDIGA